MKLPPVPYLAVSGSRTEIGKAVGEHFRPLIIAILEERRELLLSMSGCKADVLDDVCRIGWKAVQRFTPQISTEVAATAVAIAYEPHQMLIAGGYTDLIDNVQLAGPRRPLSECSVGVAPEMNALFGTWDSHFTALNALVLVQRHLESGLTSLALTTAGWPAQQGVNSSGVAFAITNLTPRAASARGLNYIAANAILAESATIGDFSRFVSHTRFASGHSYIAVDENGRSCIFETTAARSKARWKSSPTAQTNHYDSVDPLDDNSAYSFLAGSQARYAEMDSVIPNITNATGLESALSNTRYINKVSPTDLAYTCARFFISAKERAIYFGKGPSSKSTLFKICIT